MKKRKNNNRKEKKVEYLVPICIEGSTEMSAVLKAEKAVCNFNENKGGNLYSLSGKIKSCPSHDSPFMLQ